MELFIPKRFVKFNLYGSSPLVNHYLTEVAKCAILTRELNVRHLEADLDQATAWRTTVRSRLTQLIAEADMHRQQFFVRNKKSICAQKRIRQSRATNSMFTRS
jgi:hypothetical protein